MKWADTVLFEEPLADVRLLRGSPAQDWKIFLADAEKTAYERGRRDGETALNGKLIAQRNETMELQRGIFQSLQRTLPQLAHTAESTLIEVALEAAKKVVAGMTVDAVLIEATVREALRQTEDSAEIAVQMNPEDLALLRTHQSPVLNGLPESGPLKFSSSPEISRGGCLVQTRFGVVDARRETKFEQIRQSLNA
jgi:flagellar assembly protein FliH